MLQTTPSFSTREWITIVNINSNLSRTVTTGDSTIGDSRSTQETPLSRVLLATGGSAAPPPAPRFVLRSCVEFWVMLVSLCHFRCFLIYTGFFLGLFVFISFLHRKYSLSFVCHFTCIHVLSLVHILIRKSHTSDQVSVHNESYQDPVRVEGGCYSVYFLTDGRHSNRDHRPLGRRSPRWHFRCW